MKEEVVPLQSSSEPASMSAACNSPEESVRAERAAADERALSDRLASEAMWAARASELEAKLAAAEQVAAAATAEAEAAKVVAAKEAAAAAKEAAAAKLTISLTRAKSRADANAAEVAAGAAAAAKAEVKEHEAASEAAAMAAAMQREASAAREREALIRSEAAERAEAESTKAARTAVDEAEARAVVLEARLHEAERAAVSAAARSVADGATVAPEWMMTVAEAEGAAGAAGAAAKVSEAVAADAWGVSSVAKVEEMSASAARPAADRLAADNARAPSPSRVSFTPPPPTDKSLPRDAQLAPAVAARDAPQLPSHAHVRSPVVPRGELHAGELLRARGAGVPLDGAHGFVSASPVRMKAVARRDHARTAALERAGMRSTSIVRSTSYSHLPRPSAMATATNMASSSSTHQLHAHRRPPPRPSHASSSKPPLSASSSAFFRAWGEETMPASLVSIGHKNPPQVGPGNQVAAPLWVPQGTVTPPHTVYGVGGSRAGKRSLLLHSYQPVPRTKGKALAAQGSPFAVAGSGAPHPRWSAHLHTPSLRAAPSLAPSSGKLSVGKLGIGHPALGAEPTFARLLRARGEHGESMLFGLELSRYKKMLSPDTQS